jgi:hypothetical protein
MFALILSLTLLPFFEGQTENQGDARPYDEPEAYSVYEAIFPSLWPVTAAKAQRIVIQSETKPYKMCLFPDNESDKSLMGSAIADYDKVNSTSWTLQRQFKLDIPYELPNSSEIASLFAERNWKSFYERYPKSGGWIELSAVGFNSEKTVAVVYAGHHCGLLCGGGSFHVLRKKDGKWQPLKWNGSDCGWFS